MLEEFQNIEFLNDAPTAIIASSHLLDLFMTKDGELAVDNIWTITLSHCTYILVLDVGIEDCLNSIHHLLNIVVGEFVATVSKTVDDFQEIVVSIGYCILATKEMDIPGWKILNAPSKFSALISLRMGRCCKFICWYAARTTKRNLQNVSIEPRFDITVDRT